MVLSPVSQVDRLSAASDQTPQKRYFVRGRESGGAQWRTKASVFLDKTEAARSLILQEGDFNLFLKESMKTASDDAVKVTANVDISDGVIGLALIYKFSSLDRPIVLQTRGNLVYSNDGYRYKVRRSYFGAAAIPGFVAQGMVDTVLAKIFHSSEAQMFLQSWNRVAEAKTDNNLLILRWL